ncbi:hypothetical protein MNBD_CHLOROFLEXI01-4464 [hydrothermal vent metagenome]|uniref:Uncharacterized protein n=1 Tax=hydrothermal vent metagenome TaxID=652676 RepID=A0A3B0V024_9ZZZZ
MENPTYHVQVRYAVECVKQLLPQVDAATCLVLVGDLSQCRLSNLDGVVREAISVENSVYQDSYGRLTIPLSGLNKYQLKKHLLHRIGIRHLIREVQLERYGRLLFHAPNSFQNDATLSDWFQPHFVATLVQDGIFTIVHASRRATMTVQKRPSAYRFIYR